MNKRNPRKETLRELIATAIQAGHRDHRSSDETAESVCDLLTGLLGVQMHDIIPEL